MKIHVRLRYVFSFGEKVSGFRVEKLEELKPDTWHLNTDTLRLNSITNNLDLHPRENAPRRRVSLSNRLKLVLKHL
jgi:hypothetical protein